MPATPSVEVRAERERIEEIVIDPAIDHVDALRPLGRAHVDEARLHEQVAAFDQIDAELVGEERVLVIGRVVDAGGQQRDGGLARGGFRRDRLQRREQLVRIVLDRRHAMAREQLRKQPHHDLAVLQHVGDAGGRAGVVLQNVEGLGIDADDVDAGDVDIDVVRHLLAVHLRPEYRIPEHQIFRHDAGAQDLAAAVDVGEIEVERLDALLEALPEQVPFPGGEDAGDDVERNQPLGRIRLAIDREGDADAAEQQFRLATPVVQHVGLDVAQPPGQF